MKNFGIIKNTFSEILVEGIIRKDDKLKSVFKQFLKTVREDKTLRTQFAIYKNLETRQDGDFNKAILYVNENINILKKMGIDNIIKANEELLKLAEGIEVKGSYDEDLKVLHENITTLIFTKKSPDSIDTIVETASNIANHITENKKTKSPVIEDLVPNSVLTSLYLSKFDEKYSNLTESERDIIKISLLEPAKQNELYAQTIAECTVLIDTKLNNISEEAGKATLSKVKEKLNTLTYNEESFVNDLTKLIELKSTLQ